MSIGVFVILNLFIAILISNFSSRKHIGVTVDTDPNRRYPLLARMKRVGRQVWRFLQGRPVGKGLANEFLHEQGEEALSTLAVLDQARSELESAKLQSAAEHKALSVGGTAEEVRAAGQLARGTSLNHLKPRHRRRRGSRGRDSDSSDGDNDEENAVVFMMSGKIGKNLSPVGEEAESDADGVVADPKYDGDFVDTDVNSHSKVTLVPLHTLKEAFDLFDTDHSGVINASELKTAMEKLTGRPHTWEEVNNIILMVDDNNDGAKPTHMFSSGSYN